MLRILISLMLFLEFIGAEPPEGIYPDYPDMKEAMEAFGYDWEAHNVETEDGWYLTTFRIAGINGVKTQSDKPPILILHGSGGSAMGWLEDGVGPSLPGSLAERGYDVWMGNQRGTRYSNKNRRDGEWSLKERWSWTYADMGLYDVPAFIDKVLEVTNKPKLTLIGYSMGTA